MEKTTELLIEETERTIEILKTCEPGTEKYQKVREEVERLENLTIKANESEINMGIALEELEQREAEAEQKTKNDEAELKHERWSKFFDAAVKVAEIAVAAGGVVIGVVTTKMKINENRIMREQCLDFEKDNNFCSYTVKQNLKPMRF